MTLTSDNGWAVGRPGIEPGTRGLKAEGLVLTAIRRGGVPLQRIRPALAQIDKEFGAQHALASKRLYTDGVR